MKQDRRITPKIKKPGMPRFDFSLFARASGARRGLVRASPASSKELADGIIRGLWGRGWFLAGRQGGRAE